MKITPVLGALFSAALAAQSAPSMKWTDARELEIEGQAWAQVAAPFDRLPARAQAIVRGAVWDLSHHSAGLAIRFKSDADRLRARWTLTSTSLAMPHMAETGVSGLDLYVREASGAWRWIGAGRPSAVETEAELVHGLERQPREYLLYLPLYNGVKNLSIGVPEGSSITRADPRPEAQRKPIVFYGTSITQGGCASRPGMAHVALLGRQLDRPVVNLGFSGNGTLDLEIADLLGEIDAAVFVVDCLPNLDAVRVAERTEPFVRRLRAKRPATPILLVEDRRYPSGVLVAERRDANQRNAAALRHAYESLLASGVPSLYYLAADDLIGTDGEATVDGSHPTDLGFARQAATFLPRLQQALAANDGPAPIEPVPSPRQLRWHDLRYYAFVHFNMNTFTDREWGEGTESPDTFQPSGLDCRQWARVCREAGMTGIILTAKHHDGFCLWPTAFSAHSVKQSSWRGGRGDVVRELSDACREAGLKFGVYISPWDRHHPAYGDSPRYNEVFRGQLAELLSNYGEVSEVWFDGACGEGPTGKRQVYDWPSFVATVRRLQPNAVIFSDAGPDIRWVGNENGVADPTCWAMLRRDEFFPGCPNSAELTQGHAFGTHWVPAECDVSIRPGWYYHAKEDEKVKSVAQLLDLYDRSVGQNGSLLLNLPADRRGIIHENDAARLREFRAARDAIYGRNLAAGATATADSVRGGQPRFDASRVLDDDPSTFWSTNDGVNTGTLTIDLPQPTTIDRVQIEEAIRLGQRVRKFSIEVPDGTSWKKIGDGTTIGHQRIVKFEPITTARVRIRIEDARACLAISGVSLFFAPRP